MSKLERFPNTDENLSAIHPLLADIIYNRRAYLPDGTPRPLISEISRSEMFFIYSKILGMPQCQNVLEIGCAMGLSSLVIDAALAARGNQACQHWIVDPYQETSWQSIGVGHLRRAGFTNWKLFPAGSELALPQIMQGGEKFDFIFQDGMHTFDHCLLEFHYFDRILRTGGLLLYDDVDNIGVNRFIRYISLYPHWRIVACADRPAWSRGRKTLSHVQRLISPLLKVLPRRLAIEFFSDALLRPHAQLGLDSSMIALQKIGDDERPYDFNAIL